MEFRELTNEQRRQLIDGRQLFDAYAATRRRWDHSFSGSMRWVRRKGREYLHHKRGRGEKSLGLKSGETEALYAAFISGRKACKEELVRLAERLDATAPVNRALGLGRVPRTTARIVRRLDEEGLLGSQILIAGTNALFAYEARAGIQIGSDLLATNDADLLWDSRQELECLAPALRTRSIMAILRQIDQTFAARRSGDFRAQNRDGFLVDLICPESVNLVRGRGRTVIGSDPEDLRASPIFGLQWLVNAPRFEEIAIGEDGYPVRLVVPDPRAFALHKLWISGQLQRDPVKRPRDQAQAKLVAGVVRRYFGLPFDGDDLRAVPAALRALLDPDPTPDSGKLEPAW